MKGKRRCLHFWRRRQGWYSTTNNNTVFACSSCRHQWAKEKRWAKERRS